MMARVCTQASAIRLGLPGRTSLEIVSGAFGAQSMTLRLAAIPPEQPGAQPRGPHHHGCEECIFVLSGNGRTFADSGEFALNPGDTILIPAGENHVTRNTGTTPLLLLCFYPAADVAGGTVEPGLKGHGPS
jgi:mannose-6-phosphate isomerase-like protein (cupin superfamily)